MMKGNHRPNQAAFTAPGRKAKCAAYATTTAMKAPISGARKAQSLLFETEQPTSKPSSPTRNCGFKHVTSAGAAPATAPAAAPIGTPPQRRRRVARKGAE